MHSHELEVLFNLVHHLTCESEKIVCSVTSWKIPISILFFVSSPAPPHSWAREESLIVPIVTIIHKVVRADLMNHGIQLPVDNFIKEKIPFSASEFKA
jgi:hypothetical protein